MKKQLSRFIVRTSAALAFSILASALPVTAHAQQASINDNLKQAEYALRIALIEARLEGLGDRVEGITPNMILIAYGDSQELLRYFLLDDEIAAGLLEFVIRHRDNLNLYISGRLTEAEIRKMNQNLSHFFPFLPGLAS